MAGSINTIHVNTGNASYDILVGRDIMSGLARDRIITMSEGVAFVVSKRVYELHTDYINSILKLLPSHHIFMMDDGEENKNYHYAQGFLEGFISSGLTRNSLVIGIGGGVVGDFAGYLAALYMRGIPVVHIPTTLLAMVDSSIGGKVAVNLAVGKNIVGAFHQPRIVVSDVRFLSTLPGDEMKNGLTEAIKHGIIGDEYSWAIFEKNTPLSINNEDVIIDIVTRSARFKASVVEKDEKESGLRAILNFGHTVGHAIESVMGFKGISHGQAVALGMKTEVEISIRMGLIDRGDASTINELLERYSLATEKLSLKADALTEHMNFDKKNSGGSVQFVLLEKIGKPIIKQKVPNSLLLEVLRGIF